MLKLAVFDLDPQATAAQWTDRRAHEFPWVVATPATRLDAAIANAKGQCVDFIVIDTPPVLGSADINLVQDTVDGIALALAAKRSTARDIRRTLDQLGDNKIVGTVFLE